MRNQSHIIEMEQHLSTSRKLVGSLRKCTRWFDEEFELHGHSATLVGNYVFVIGGVHIEPLHNVYVLDCNKFTWSARSGNPLLNLYDPQAFLIEDKIYLVGGNAEPQIDPVASQMWNFDIVQSYIQTCDSKNQDLIPSRGSAGAFLEAIGMFILYGGAIEAILLSSVLGYSPSTDTWLQFDVKGGTPPSCKDHSACSHGKNDIFFYGGRDENGITSRVFHLRCEPGTFLWNEVFWYPTPIPRVKSTLNCIGNRIFILGGTLANGVSKSNYLYVYDLAAEAAAEFHGRRLLQDHDSLPLVREGFVCRRTMHKSVVLKGRVLVIGGLGASPNAVYILAATKQ